MVRKICARPHKSLVLTKFACQVQVLTMYHNLPFITYTLDLRFNNLMDLRGNSIDPDGWMDGLAGILPILCSHISIIMAQGHL